MFGSKVNEIGFCFVSSLASTIDERGQRLEREPRHSVQQHEVERHSAYQFKMCHPAKLHSMLSTVMPGVIFYSYAECHYAESRYAECRYDYCC
jgi:hypothetical protein